MTKTLTATRTLHLVDIENLVGDPYAPAADVLETLDAYLALAGWQEGDHVILAANPGLLAKVAFDLPISCNTHAVRGTDGADLMLLSHAEPGWVASRFGCLVVGSGDGVFAATAAAVRDLGVPVVVVARRRSISSALQGAGYGVRLLTDPIVSTPADTVLAA